MKLTDDWLTAPATQAVMQMLETAGHQAFFVGGCVRNAALGAPVSDLDIATDAPPQSVITLANAAGLKPIPTGIEHGTVTVVSDHIPHEITTFRRDEETDGRHALVAFSTDIAEDAARRDFTMNALYARSDGEVLDPLGSGLADLQARHLRFVGHAEDRIREDYLRILRFFRFTAWYGAPENGPDAEGLAACAALAEGIDGLARERIGAEMRKLLAAPDPAPVIASMAQTGILSRLLPGADAKALPVLIHLENGRGPDPLRRLACLTSQPATAALRLSRAEAKRLARLREAAQDIGSPTEMGYRLGVEDGCDAWLVRAALLEMPMTPDWPAQIAFGAAQTFPVTARDLLPALQGKELGDKLAELEMRWIGSGFTLDRAHLLG
ncbi:CCA tRNA nucleotidyltransferase [Thioclava litoralis]|uniref:CCA tRNA nucleotidyltransferase n=1 Tax=Thioclava litoralis TaxID=3076557 RepID=A0ABZ1E4Z7_9RHOB|nr:CCA tRNA nucleotidyltransferase [Thioclava sp. FTW29]